MSKLTDGAVLLALGTAILFCSGTAYYHGYVSTLGLVAQVVERGFHQTLYQGLILVITPAVYLLVVVSPLLYIFSHGILEIYVDIFEGRYTRKKKLIKAKRFWLGRRKDARIQVIAKRLANKSLLVSVVMALFFFSMYSLEKKGSDKAKELLSLGGKEGIVENNIVAADIEGQKLELQLLTCGAENCAGLRLDDRRVFYFSHTSFSHIQ